ncbi:hypothetical protein [Campylobacter troglodytis]|uniref:hypothetical protein n=1 Tax=Campylobacter troglodytis TaxID=654363 RepID=UPI00115C3927|nr:hypothetical protein [Campylobacter troglodytis]
MTTLPLNPPPQGRGTCLVNSHSHGRGTCLRFQAHSQGRGIFVTEYRGRRTDYRRLITEYRIWKMKEVGLNLNSSE